MWLSIMSKVKKLSVAALLLINRHTNAEDADILTSNLIHWVRSNGGFVSEKIAFRHIDNDPNSPRGVFAVDDIEEGETLAIIPWELIIKSPERAAGKVAGKWSHNDCGVIQETLNAITASDNAITPYGKYLASQPLNYTVGFWTESGQDLFVELTGGTLQVDNILPPTDIDDQLIWEFKEACNGDITDPMAVQAAMLVRARSDYEYMVPIYGEICCICRWIATLNNNQSSHFYLNLILQDMFNHDNGKYNIQHKYNPYTSPLQNTGYGVITSRKIHAGEELYNSYNRCNICDGYLDWFGTPEMYLVSKSSSVILDVVALTKQYFVPQALRIRGELSTKMVVRFGTS